MKNDNIVLKFKWLTFVHFNVVSSVLIHLHFALKYLVRVEAIVWESNSAKGCDKVLTTRSPSEDSVHTVHPIRVSNKPSADCQRSKNISEETHKRSFCKAQTSRGANIRTDTGQTMQQ